MAKTPGRGRIFNDITETIGDTPIIRLDKLANKHKVQANLLAKLEFFNPIASVKDRIGVNMLNAMEKKGIIKPGKSVLIEPTSGNTGVALAFAAAQKGYRLILTMPETMSIERRKMLALLGAELVLTEGPKGMKGAIAAAEELAEKTKNAVIPQQFENPANPEIHRKTTGPEIWNDTRGRVDAFVSGIGTGGTITGAGRYLKRKNPKLHVVAIEPADSPVLSGVSPARTRYRASVRVLRPAFWTRKSTMKSYRFPTKMPLPWPVRWRRLRACPSAFRRVRRSLPRSRWEGARSLPKRTWWPLSQVSPSVTCQRRCLRGWGVRAERPLATVCPVEADLGKLTQPTAGK